MCQPMNLSWEDCFIYSPSVFNTLQLVCESFSGKIGWREESQLLKVSIPRQSVVQDLNRGFRRTNGLKAPEIDQNWIPHILKYFLKALIGSWLPQKSCANPAVLGGDLLSGHAVRTKCHFGHGKFFINFQVLIQCVSIVWAEFDGKGQRTGWC